MTTQPQPEALRLAGALLEPVVLDKHAMQAADELLRLHAECETLRQANVAFAARQAWWNDRMVALEAECEAMHKSLALVQQHHATAWNRGHTMGVAASQQIVRQAKEAVARDAWGNTQLTEALLAAEAECEALRAVIAAFHYHHKFGDGLLASTIVRECEEVVPALAAIDAARAAKEQSK